jgi:hypothetical protein
MAMLLGVCRTDRLCEMACKTHPKQLFYLAKYTPKYYNLDARDAQICASGDARAYDACVPCCAAHGLGDCQRVHRHYRGWLPHTKLQGLVMSKSDYCYYCLPPLSMVSVAYCCLQQHNFIPASTHDCMSSSTLHDPLSTCSM